MVFTPFFKTKTYYEDDNKQNKKLDSGAIIISNHRSWLDAILIAIRFFFKRMHFLAANWYKNRLKFFGFAVRTAGGIFVDTNGQSFDFIEKSKRVINKNRPILIFPEGDFKKEYEPQKFSAGYIMLAAKTGAKIVPVVSDFNYGFFKRVHLMVGNHIDLSCYKEEELTKTKIKDINEEIRNKFLMLFYQLKKKKAKRLEKKYRYDFIAPQKGAVIRIFMGSYYHYGVYFNNDEVIQFGLSDNRTGGTPLVNSVSFIEFCGDKIPEVRVFKGKNKRYLRRIEDVEKYAKSCISQSNYCLARNNCIDFANRITLNI